MREAGRRLAIKFLRAGTPIQDRVKGGTIYEFHIVESLRAVHDVAVVPIANVGAGGVRRLADVFRNTPRHSSGADVCILDVRAMAAFRRVPGVRYIGICHHLDFDSIASAKRRLLWRFLVRRGFRRTDTVVAVSRYWRDRFVAIGVRDVRVIYNPFEVERIRRTVPGDFRARYGLPAGRPIVYVGQNGPLKGAGDVSALLKHEPYTLVSSGKGGASTADVLHLDLPYDDYLRLLASASVAVVMPRLREGWCRVAHEAMMVGTPVIGSGVAGMAELLDGGCQIIIADPAGLSDAVRDLLRDEARRRRMAESGAAFARTFTMERFARAWLDLVSEPSQAAGDAPILCGHHGS